MIISNWNRLYLQQRTQYFCRPIVYWYESVTILPSTTNLNQGSNCQLCTKWIRLIKAIIAGVFVVVLIFPIFMFTPHHGMKVLVVTTHTRRVRKNLRIDTLQKHLCNVKLYTTKEKNTHWVSGLGTCCLSHLGSRLHHVLQSFGGGL